MSSRSINFYGFLSDFLLCSGAIHMIGQDLSGSLDSWQFCRCEFGVIVCYFICQFVAFTSAPDFDASKEDELALDKRSLVASLMIQRSLCNAHLALETIGSTCFLYIQCFDLVMNPCMISGA